MAFERDYTFWGWGSFLLRMVLVRGDLGVAVTDEGADRTTVDLFDGAGSPDVGGADPVIVPDAPDAASRVGAGSVPAPAPVPAPIADIGPEAFCRAIHPRLVGSLRLYLGDTESARELAQDALVRVIERWPQVRDMDHPEAWTYRVAFNLARSRMRRTMAESRARRRADRPPASSWGVDVADVLAIRAAIHELPPRQRQAIVLRFYGDLTVDQIGEAMSCRSGTVKAHLHQGLTALRAAGLTHATDADTPTQATDDPNPSLRPQSEDPS